MNIELLSMQASQLSSLRCGGEMKKTFVPRSCEEAEQGIELCFGEDILVLGSLTNTLVLSGGVKQTVFLTENLRGFTVEREVIKASAGERLASVARAAKSYGLAGLENLSSVPGTVGGAVKGNCGCFGTEISEVITAVEILRLDTGEREILNRDEIAFRHRYSNLTALDFITKVHFQLYRAPIERINARMNDVHRKRKATQPTLPSLGCVFKKSGDVGAGFYIEKVGLKGYSHGGMEFSEVHANFIVNKGGTAEDYLYLVRLAEHAVYENLGIKLEREIKIIGEES